MSQPYFDHRSLLALGIPKHTVDALQETFTRTGGHSDVALTLTDLEVLATTALDQGRIAQRLRDRVTQLEADIASIPSYTRQIAELRGRMSDLENQILSIPNVRLNQLQAQINDLSLRMDDVPRVNLHAELRGRMSDLENQILSIPNVRLNQLQAQINDLSIRMDDVPRVNLHNIYRRLEVLEAL